MTGSPRAGRAVGGDDPAQPVTVLQPWRGGQEELRPEFTTLARRKLREVTASQVRQALSVFAASRSSATVSLAHNCLQRAIRQAEARDLVRRDTWSRPASEGHVMPVEQARGYRRARRQETPARGNRRRLRSCAATSAAITIPVAAMLLLAAAGGASAATTQSASQVAAHASQHSRIAGHGTSVRQMTAATNVTWHKLTLIHGWRPFRNPSMPTGPPPTPSRAASCTCPAACGSH